MAHEIEIAWAAGLFEGEGYMSMVKAKPRKDGLVRKNIIVGLISTDRDVLFRFMAIVGFGNVHERKKQEPHHKDAWVWQSTKHESFVKLLEMFMPYLCERRRDRALEVLHEYQQQPVRRVSKTHCPHGHEFTPKNTLLINGKWRRCRECNRLSQKVQHERRKAAA
jgi:hypothetical protein